MPDQNTVKQIADAIMKAIEKDIDVWAFGIEKKHPECQIEDVSEKKEQVRMQTLDLTQFKHQY